MNDYFWNFMSFFVKICIKIMFEFDGEIFVHLYNSNRTSSSINCKVNKNLHNTDSDITFYTVYDEHMRMTIVFCERNQLNEPIPVKWTTSLSTGTIQIKPFQLYANYQHEYLFHITSTYIEEYDKYELNLL